MREADIQRRILRELKKLGAWSVKVMQASRNGTPDILACLNGRFVAIEVKGPRGKPTVLQLEQIARIEDAGGIAMVARSWEDVIGDDEMKMEAQLAIRMSAEMREKLEARAQREGRPVTQMARVIIERALRKEK